MSVKTKGLSLHRPVQRWSLDDTAILSFVVFLARLPVPVHHLDTFTMAVILKHVLLLRRKGYYVRDH